MAFPFLSPGAAAYYYYGKFDHNAAGMKTTESYLMLAECLAREGNVDDALEALNVIRRKRILPADYADLTAIDAAEAMQLVLTERRRELALTFNRFFDMRRLNTEAEYRKTYTKTVNGIVRTLNPGSHLYIAPFSKEATMRNPNLKQNTQ